MKRANRNRITEKNLSEHIRQENAAYRKIIRKQQPCDCDPDLPSQKCPRFCAGDCPGMD